MRHAISGLQSVECGDCGQQLGRLDGFREPSLSRKHRALTLGFRDAMTVTERLTWRGHGRALQ